MKRNVVVPRLSFATKRIIAGVGFFLMLASIANYYFGIGVLAHYKKEILSLTFIAVALVLNYFGPTLQEVREHRDRKE